MRSPAERYSYRRDPTVPPFPDDRPLIVFDGVCGLCSASARFVLRHDRRGVFRLSAAQSPLGRALYRHYGLDPDAMETVLVVAEGRAYAKTDAAVLVLTRLGLPWSAAGAARLVPRALADRLYDRLARNRYRIAGRRDRCMVPPAEWRERFIA
ncbi:MAG: thiol-disulfide oxidoreductase DCC family protein [Rhodospirillaceae bacterium]|nr:thiol-disulfide oxidoreductase DCC family protein [Rhodospirillaceae bacterium]